MARTPSLHFNSSPAPSPSCTWNISIPFHLILNGEAGLTISDEIRRRNLLQRLPLNQMCFLALFLLILSCQLSWLNKFCPPLSPLPPLPSLKVLFHFCPQLFSPLQQQQKVQVNIYRIHLDISPLSQGASFFSPAFAWTWTSWFNLFTKKIVLKPCCFGFPVSSIFDFCPYLW